MFNSESIPTKFQNIYWQKKLELGIDLDNSYTNGRISLEAM